MKKNTEKLKLDNNKLSEILIFITEKRLLKMSDKNIRKEIFKKFELDITLYDFKFPAKGDRAALVHQRDMIRTKEPTSFKHTYTEQEINEFGRSSANLVSERDSLEEEKKLVTADYKQKIEEKKTKIKDLSRKILTGFYMRNEMCEVVKDFSKGSKKIYFNGTLVSEDKLTAADFTLPFPTTEN